MSIASTNPDAMSASTTSASPTVGPPTRNGRRRILDAAAQLFVERGYAETSLRDLATAVDMKAGSLYYHFASKDELLVELFAEGIVIMIDHFESAAPSAPDTAGAVPEPVSQLRPRVRAHLRALHDNHPITTLHVTTFRNAPEAVRAEILPQRDAYEAMWTTLLHDVVPNRTSQEISILRLTLFGAMNASIEWFDAGRGNLDEFADLVTDQFWSGVGPPTDRPSLSQGKAS